TELFLGGVAIGLITMVSYILMIILRVKLNPELAPSVKEAIPMSEKMAALKDVWPILLVMIGIFGGLFSGLFTPTEAGAVGALLSCVVAMVARSLTWERFK